MRTLLLSLGLCLACAFQHLAAQSYVDFVEKSYEFLDKEDLPSAAESLKAAMRLEPGNPNNYALLMNLGTIQRRMGKPEEALISYNAALGQQPQNLLILENRATHYTDMGEIEKAITDYKTKILSINPDHQEALYCRGMLYLQQKLFVAAEDDFERIVNINERSIKGRFGYAILEKLRGNYNESERIFNFLINEMPRAWYLYEGRADLYFMMGKNARAMADINKLFVESEPTATLYVLRGKVKIAQYEKESAAQDFRKALEMGYDPKVIEELLKMTE